MIREARLKKKLSQQKLADILGVTKGAISQWETGVGYPKRVNAKLLAESLGISARRVEAYLMSGLTLLDTEPAGREIPLYEFRVLAHLDLNGERRGGKRVNTQEVGYLIGDQDIPGDAIAARVADDSMGPEFLPGDLVIFSKETLPNSKDVVVAIVDGESAVLRRYEPRGRKDGVEVFDLVPTSLDHHTVSSNSASGVKVLGTVVEHRKKRRQ